MTSIQHHLVLAWPRKGLLRSCVSFHLRSWLRPKRQHVASGRTSSGREKPAAFDAWLRAYQQRLEDCCRPPSPLEPPG